MTKYEKIVAKLPPMTISEKICYLKKYISTEQEIRRAEQELEKWRSKAEKVTSTVSDMPRGGESLTREDIVLEIVCLEEYINAQIYDSVIIRKDIEKAVSGVVDDRIRLLLTYRYVDGLTFEEIAEEMELSRQWIRILHTKAINSLKL